MPKKPQKKRGLYDDPVPKNVSVKAVSKVRGLGTQLSINEAKRLKEKFKISASINAIKESLMDEDYKAMESRRKKAKKK